MKCPVCPVEIKERGAFDAHLRDVHRLVECCPVCSSIDIRTEDEIPWSCPPCCEREASGAEDDYGDTVTWERRRVTCKSHVPKYARRCRMCGWTDTTGEVPLPWVHVLTRAIVPLPVEFIPDPVCPGDFKIEVNGEHLGHGCTHGETPWRVGFDWGQAIATFATKAEVETWARERAARIRREKWHAVEDEAAEKAGVKKGFL
jgi:hypothetical protein